MSAEKLHHGLGHYLHDKSKSVTFQFDSELSFLKTAHGL
jgi:hypothetical protein